jgi:hypothetical protein
MLGGLYVIECDNCKSFGIVENIDGKLKVSSCDCVKAELKGDDR